MQAMSVTAMASQPWQNLRWAKDGPAKRNWIEFATTGPGPHYWLANSILFMNLRWSSVSGPVLVSNYCAMVGMRLVNAYWLAIEGHSVVFCNWPCNGPLWITQSLYETSKSTLVRKHYAIDGPLLIFSNSVVFCNRPCNGPLFVWNRQIHSG